MNINDKLKELGFATISEDFYSKVQEWKSWYIGDVKGFHRYKVRNGTSMVRCKRYTLNMGKKIPEDWANLLMNEKVEITLEGQREQEFIDRVFAENNFLVQVNEMRKSVCTRDSGLYTASSRHGSDGVWSHSWKQQAAL